MQTTYICLVVLPLSFFILSKPFHCWNGFFCAIYYTTIYIETLCSKAFSEFIGCFYK